MIYLAPDYVISWRKIITPTAGPATAHWASGAEESLKVLEEL